MCTGSLPSQLCTLHSLERLSIGGALLDGTIPSDIGSMFSLLSLDLAGNFLHGRLNEPDYPFVIVDHEADCCDFMCEL
jgi:hypothetical protein